MIKTGLPILLLIAISAPVSRGDEPAESLAAARTHLLRGRYEEGIEEFTKLLAGEAVGVQAAIGLSRCREETGLWDEAATAIETALERHADQPDLLARSAELAFARGDVDRAERLAARSLAKNADQLFARFVAARIADAKGDYGSALREYEWFVHFYNKREVKQPEELAVIGQAAAEYAQRALKGRNQSQQLGAVLNQMFDAAAADKDFWPARYLTGRLFLEKHKRGDAANDLQKAVAINPNAAAVHLALGVAAFNEFDIEGGHTHADRALEINSRLPDARRLKADLCFVREQFAEAVAELERAREVNATDEETLGRLAACFHLTRRTAEFERLRDEVVTRNKRPVIFYLRLAERLEDLRRFDLAEGFFKLSLDADPSRPATRTGLGMLFMRIGKEDDARTMLDDAFEADPFNVRTKNMLEVLDQLKGYRVFETEHFHVKVDDKLDGLLGRYAAKYLEEVYAELTERFGFHPEGPIQIEIFNKGRGQSAHQWFSARTVGLPWIGTVGACTGKVVAMASPRGVEKPFNWARVLKHEVAHVITLQQTHFNIPHWYTEALAVQSEAYPRPQVWNQLLLDRVPSGKLFTLDNINLAFARPKTQLDWQMAYCQSELYAEYMQSRFGADSTARLLDAYRDGMTTPEAVDRVFQVPKSDFEAGYVEHLKKVTAGLRSGPAEPPALSLPELEKAVAADPNNPDLAARLAVALIGRRQYPRARELAMKAAKAKKNHPLGSYALARLSMVVGDTDRARELLEPALDKSSPDPRVLELLAELRTRANEHAAARELYELGRKLFPGESKWIAGLARIALLNKDRPALLESLEELSLLDADDPSPRKKLAAMATEDGNWENAARYAEMTLHIDVADVEAHRLLADALVALQRWPAAADELRVLRELQPGDASVALKLARALRDGGQNDAATTVVKEILEKDPENAAARELLKELNR